MRKIINVSFIILVIIGICLAEQLLSSNYLNELSKKTDHIESLLYVTEDINLNDIPYFTDELYTYWSEKENILCTFVNHKEIDDIGVEINRLKTALKLNDRDKYEESLNLINYYTKSYQHVIRVNFQNIF